MVKLLDIFTDVIECLSGLTNLMFPFITPSLTIFMGRRVRFDLIRNAFTPSS